MTKKKDDATEVIVTVAGYAGVGKTTILKIIVAALASVGVKTEVEESELPQDDGFHQTRVAALRKFGVHVKLKTKQRRRGK